jgi:hypothetical protein
LPSISKHIRNSDLAFVQNFLSPIINQTFINITTETMSGPKHTAGDKREMRTEPKGPPPEKAMQPMPDHIHRPTGEGNLNNMSAAGGVTLPSDSGTQNVVHSQRREDHVTTDPDFRFPSADNTTALPEDPRSEKGLTGEVLTGIGDQMPAGCEAKHVGPTHGGKHTGPERHTFRSMHAQDMQGSGPGYRY